MAEASPADLGARLKSVEDALNLLLADIAKEKLEQEAAAKEARAQALEDEKKAAQHAEEEEDGAGLGQGPIIAFLVIFVFGILLVLGWIVVWNKSLDLEKQNQMRYGELRTLERALEQRLNLTLPLD